MKKIICALMAGFMCFSLSACGSSDKESSSKKEEQKEEKKKNYGVNDVVEMKDRNFKVTKVTTSEGDDFTKPEDGKVFVLIDVSIENTSDKEISYNVLDFEVQNGQGQIDNLGFSMLQVVHPLNSGKLAPEGKISGTLIAEEPKDDVNNMTLIYKVGVFDQEEVKVSLQS